MVVVIIWSKWALIKQPLGGSVVLELGFLSILISKAKKSYLARRSTFVNW